MKKIVTGIKQLRKKASEKKHPVALSLDTVDWPKAEKLFSADRIQALRRQETQSSDTVGTRQLLKILAAGCVITLSLVAPNVLVALGPLMLGSGSFEKKSLRQSVARLRRQKLVRLYEKDGMTVVQITQEGRVRALRYKLNEMAIRKQERWDKKWRVVIFDIPEREKRMRELFREFLKRIGCVAVQKSVYIHPYLCFNEIEYLRQIFGIGINVTYMVVDRIEGADELLETFGLT